MELKECRQLQPAGDALSTDCSGSTAPDSWNLQQMWKYFLMRRLPLCLLILSFEVGSPCWADGIIAGAIVENHSFPSRSADTGGDSADRFSIIEKLGSG